MSVELLVCTWFVCVKSMDDMWNMSVFVITCSVWCVRDFTLSVGFTFSSIPVPPKRLVLRIDATY